MNTGTVLRGGFFHPLTHYDTKLHAWLLVVCRILHMYMYMYISNQLGVIDYDETTEQLVRPLTERQRWPYYNNYTGSLCTIIGRA